MLNRQTISSFQKNSIVYVILTLATLAVFWQVRNYDFVNIDDKFFVAWNSHIKSGFTLDGLQWAFSISFDDFWMPLTRLSFLIDYQFYGLQAGGYHLTNLLLHIMSTLFLFRLFSRMTAEIWKSAFVAAFFALHPLHVESVAWVAERKDVLNAFFWMLTLNLYVYYAERPSVKRYLPVMFSFILDLMSKPMVVTLPFVMMLLDYWPLKRFESKKESFASWQLKEKMPLLIVSAIFSVITLLAHNRLLAKPLPVTDRILNAPVSFVSYLGKTFWPQDLAVFYPFPAQIPVWQFAGACLLIAVISIFVIIGRKRLPCLFVGWFWFMIVITPVIGIIQISLTAPFAMTDRYHYLPSIGIAVMLAWGIPHFIKNEKARKKILIPLATACLVLLSVLSWRQCRYWQNSTTLFTRAVHVTKDNTLAHNNLASALLAEGKMEEAVIHYGEALRITPGNVHSYTNRGNAFAALGRYRRAIDDYSEAIRFQPDYILAYYNRGLSYNNLGLFKLAIEDFNRAAGLSPEYPATYINRGIAYARLGQNQTAVNDFSKAISLNGNYAEAYINRSIIYLSHGINEQGCSDARKACALGQCGVFRAAVDKGFCQ